MSAQDDYDATVATYEAFLPKFRFVPAKGFFVMDLCQYQDRRFELRADGAGMAALLETYVSQRPCTDGSRKIHQRAWKWVYGESGREGEEDEKAAE